MSLVAAVAVAGMTTAQAKDLTEAIKGVDVSGTVVYRYQDYQGQANDIAGASNNYKIGMSVKAPVNDDVTANTRFLVASGSGNFASLNTTTAADSNVDVTLSQVNFAYTGIANTTVVVGKQGLATPWTNAIDSDGSEQTGSGILAASTFGPVTAAAGYFNQTNLTSEMLDGAFADDNITATQTVGAQDLMVAGLMGKFGPVSAEAWYMDLADLADSYFVKASASFDIDAVKLGLFAQYQDSELDSQEIDAGLENDFGLLKTGISAKMGIFGAAYTYAKTADSGSGVLNAVSKNSAIGWNVSLHDYADSKMHMFNINAQVLPELNIALKHNVIDEGNNAASTSDEEEETYAEITYKMSKNFGGYLRLGTWEVEGVGVEEQDVGRLQVQYTF